MTFKELEIIEPILRALKDEGYEVPTPIQQKAIPIIIEGNDILGCAQTGTGKTAAFSIPILQKFHQAVRGGKHRPIKALVLTPTRELAIQIDESFATYGKYLGLKHMVVFGGVGQRPQTDMLASGIDILTATPGRLLDLIKQGFVNLKTVEFFVLDEADRMLDMGFIHDIKRILPLLPRERQTLLFSATMPKEIATLANSMLRNPRKVEVTPVSSTVDVIDQSIYHVEKALKIDLLIDLLGDDKMESVLVFSRTKHGADKISKMLNKAGITSEAIHGNKSQSARQRALSNFKERITRVLIATDIAARGIDIDRLSHVINYDLPEVPECYVHRIGRTGRAGCEGVAIAFCDSTELTQLRDIEKLIRKQIPVVEEHAYIGTADTSSLILKPVEKSRSTQSSNRKGGNGGQNRNTNFRRPSTSKGGNTSK